MIDKRILCKAFDCLVLAIVLSAQVLFFNIYSIQNCNALSSADNNKQKIVSGIACGNTTVTGMARLVKSLDDCYAIQPGEIIVAKTMHESWRSCMSPCAGIITDLGDENSYAFLFGKNNGIPVLVGAGNATKKIKTGDIVTVVCLKSSYGYVYKASKHDLPCKTFSIISNGAQSAIYYGGIDTVDQSRGRISNSPIYYSHKDQGGMIGNQIIHKKEANRLSITQEVFNTHYPKFVDYVLAKKKALEYALWFGGESSVLRAATTRWGGYCDAYTVKCIPLSYGFFSKPEEYLKSLMKELLREEKLNYINHLIEKCSMKPAEIELMVNWISRISHEGHVSNIAIPSHVDIAKEELIADPLQYKKIMDNKDVDEKESHIFIACGLFADYWCTNKCKA